MFVRRKKVKNHHYYYLVKQTRCAGTLKQVVVEYLGTMRYSDSIKKRFLKELEKKHNVNGLWESFLKAYRKPLKRKKRGRPRVRKKKENKR